MIQAGFVSKSQGAVEGMYSLASALSGQFDGDFLACWKVDEDRYALVATLDGAIVPGQDLVTTLDEARDRVRKLSTRGVLRNAQVFVPEGFDFPVKDFDIEECTGSPGCWRCRLRRGCRCVGCGCRPRRRRSCARPGRRVPRSGGPAGRTGSPGCPRGCGGAAGYCHWHRAGSRSARGRPSAAAVGSPGRTRG